MPKGTSIAGRVHGQALPGVSVVLALFDFGDVQIVVAQLEAAARRHFFGDVLLNAAPV